jgi:hypothetical protein
MFRTSVSNFKYNLERMSLIEELLKDWLWKKYYSHYCY